MSDYEPVLQTRELGPGESREVEVHGDHVLLLNIGQIYHALEGRCPESGNPLELEPRRTADRLVCPADHAQYDVATGERVDARGRPLRRYDVRIEGNAIKIGPPA